MAPTEVRNQQRGRFAHDLRSQMPALSLVRTIAMLSGLLNFELRARDYSRTQVLMIGLTA